MTATMFFFSKTSTYHRALKQRSDCCKSVKYKKKCITIIIIYIVIVTDLLFRTTDIDNSR